MQFSSLPINSSLQNNPRYIFSLKSENIEILPSLAIFFGQNILPTLLNIYAKFCGNPFGGFRYKWGQRFPWQWWPFWKFQDLNAPLEMGIHLPVKFSKDRIASLWEFGRTNWLRRRRGGIIIIIRRNGAKTISLQTSFGDLIIIRNAAKTIGLQT